MNCGRETFAPEDSADIDDESASPVESNDDELNGLRIRQLATARRAAYRARSYAVIAGFVFAVATGDLLYHAGRHILSATTSAWTWAYLMFAILCGVATVIAFRRAIDLHREATAPAQLEPKESPVFESLSDGSQQWERLEEVE